MAAVLSRNSSNLREVTKCMDECRAMGIQVLGPDVNESVLKFGVNRQGDIRFGLGAVKGVGEGAVANILEERKRGGPFKDIYDFAERINLNSSNKKVFDSLALSGALDNLGVRREPFVTPNEKNETFSETIIRYGHKFQLDKSSSQNSLFGASGEIEIARPPAPSCEPWADLERLNREKELIGIYLSAHPLDEYRIILNHVCSAGLADLSDLTPLQGRELLLGGIVTASREGIARNGKPFMIIKMEDFTGTGEIPLFGKDALDYGKYGKPGMYLFIRATVQPKQWKDGELEIRIRSIQLLQDVKDELVRKFSITVPVRILNSQIINELSVYLKKNPGKAQLYFKVVDGEHEVSLNLFSRSLRLHVTQDLIDFINEFDSIDFAINK
jgi:DNA polymerase-3 subunit alpha